jgi:DNA polymerase III delta prime subunit
MSMTAQQLIATFPTFGDLPLNRSNTKTIRILRAVAQGRPRNLLLRGKYGHGKTALAELLPRWSYASQGNSLLQPNFLDCSAGLNLALLNKEQTTWAQFFGVKEEWFILDEIDKVTTKKHKNAVLGVLRPYDPPRYFILTANDLKQVHRGVLSRCDVLEIVAPTPADYLPYAQSRLKAEGVILTDAHILGFLQSVMNGDMRHVERNLDDVVIAINALDPGSCVVP